MRYIICCLCLLGGFVGRAQPLDTLIGQATRANSRVSQLDQQYRAALTRADQMAVLPDPELGVGLGLSPVETRLGPQQVRVGLTQALPWPGTLAARAAYQHALAEAHRSRTDEQVREIDYAVRLAYLDAYENQRLDTLLRRHLIWLRSMENLALAKVENGRGTLSDVLQIQLRQQEIAQRIAVNTTDATLPRIRLNTLLERDLTTPLTLPDTLLPPTLPTDVTTLLREIETVDPRLAEGQQRSVAAELSKEVARLDRRPMLGVGVDYIFTGSRSDASPAGNGRDAIIPRIGIRLPLQQQSYRARVAEADYLQRMYDDAIEVRRYELAATVATAYAEYERQEVLLENIRAQRRTLARIIDLQTTVYANAGTELVELLRLHRQLIDHDITGLRAVLGMHRAVAALEKLR